MTNKPEPCILPWINFCTNPYGRSRPCGYSKFKSPTKVKDSTVQKEFNNDLYKQVRLDFLAGKWPENCQRCQFMEETHPGKSKKFSEHSYYESYQHLIKETNHDGSVNHFPKQIDIRLGTVCNLKCIHCGTGNSNKWAEDSTLIGKYENTKKIKIDNRWVNQDSELWENIKSHLNEIEKFNFLGGEPFASLQHQKLINHILEHSDPRKITLHYVTNGTLLTEEMIQKLKNFRKVTLNVSFDAGGEVLEFYRFPLKSDRMEKILSLLDTQVSESFSPGLQWTSSNISLFYLDQTLDEVDHRYKNLEFKLCNFVDSPIQMSPQNLPRPLKERITKKLEPYIKRRPDIEFYLKHMHAEDLWPQRGPLLLEYLNDLTTVRGLDWKNALKEFYREIQTCM